MAEKSGNYASFFVQKRLIFNFTPIHQVLSELFKKTILPYETERQGPDQVWSDKDAWSHRFVWSESAVAFGCIVKN